MRRLTPARIRTASWILYKVATHFVRRPARLRDIPRWIRGRNTRTMDARLPWWPFHAVEVVDSEIPRGTKVFEFGGGGSSLWFVDKGADLTVVEHDAEWSQQLSDVLRDQAVVKLVQPSEYGHCRSRLYPDRFFDDYVEAIRSENDESLDLVVVDGRARVDCGLAAMAKIRPGGLLLLDDSDRSRYGPLKEALSAWQRRDFRGLKLGGGPPCQTSLWRKP